MKLTTYKMRGVIHDTGEVREGTNRKEEPYAARTVWLDEQKGGEPIGFDFYRQGDKTNWVTTNFNHEVGDLVDIEFYIQGGSFKTKNGNVLSQPKLRLWSISGLNREGSRVTAKKSKPAEPVGTSDEEDDDLPF